MFANERQDTIMTLLHTKGAVTTAELTAMFGVSIETIRRDLMQLSEQNLLQRVHGGAVVPGKMKHFETLTRRIEENKTAKIELCETAADFVAEGDMLGIDSGSTALYFAEVLCRRFHKLIVVTHSLDVADVISKKSDFELIVIGGYLLKEENAFYGPPALDMAKKLHTQKLFLTPSAISLKGGIGDFCPQLLTMQQALVENADQLFVLADSNKFEKHALLQLCPLDSQHTYVTDSGLSTACRQLYEENNLTVVVRK